MVREVSLAHPFHVWDPGFDSEHYDPENSLEWFWQHFLPLGVVPVTKQQNFLRRYI